MENKEQILQKLEFLRKNLPHGSIKKVSEETGHSRQHVTKVLKGERYDNAVLESFIRIATVEGKLYKKTMEQIDSLME